MKKSEHASSAQNLGALFAKLKKKADIDPSRYSMELGDQRLVDLPEILNMYKKLNIRVKPFEIDDEHATVITMPPHPRVDVMYEMQQLELKPSFALLNEKGSKAKNKNSPNSNPNEFEFNGYTQLILFCAIESKLRRQREAWQV